jgi:hypothetical protein
MHNKKTLLFISTLLAGMSVSLQAAVFEDTFTDNDRTTSPAWYSIGTPDIGQSGGVLSLGAFSSGGHKYLFSHFTGATLASVGDQLVLSFRIKLTGDQGNRSNELSFGIGNDRGTIVTADTNTVTTYNDDLGYIAGIGTGTGTSSIIRDTGTSQFLGRLFDANDQTILSAATAGMAITSSFKDYTMTLSRTASGLDIQLTDGTTSVSISDNAVPGNDFYTFNTMGFGYYNRNTANSLDVDSISVDFTPVPEPSTYAILAGFAALGLVMYRRRVRA